MGGFWSMYYIDRVRVFKIMIGHLGFGAANPVQPSISTKNAEWRIREIKPSGWKRFLPIPW